MSNAIQKGLSSVMNYVVPMWGGYNPLISQRDAVPPQNVAKNLNRYISPVQVQRIKQDGQTWRDCITEAENAWYPHRVKMQKLYVDTVLNGHVAACLQRRFNLTMLKDWKWANEAGVEDKKTTALFKKPWFRDYMRYVLEAKAFGYSLIYLDDLINDEFPKLSTIRRFNVSPDRLNVTHFVYSISGAPFTEEPFSNWHIWVPTPTDVGVSPVGYGYLYKVAFYEIIARNVITQNVDATEMYGMPIRVGKTNKTMESGERQIFEQMLANMGSSGWMLMDPTGDEVDLMESKSLGNGYKIYESLEKRCESKISKIILGHADTMDSIPGKLGAQDQADSPVNKALRDTATNDMNDLMDVTNNQLAPKLKALGFVIPDGITFQFDNNEETQAVRIAEDKANLSTAQVFQSIKTAGGDPDWDYFSGRTGIKTKKMVLPTPVASPAPGGGAAPGNGQQPKPGEQPKVDPKIKARLDQLYGTGRQKNGNGHSNGHVHAS